MNECKFVIMDINKVNINYSVMNVDDDHRKNFKWLVDNLTQNSRNTEQQIIFCSGADDMRRLFQYFQIEIGNSQYSEECKQDDTGRLFTMYHHKTDPKIQASIRLSFILPTRVI